MKENIIKIIPNIRFWPKGISTLHYYNLIFTDRRLIFEFIDKNVYVGPLYGNNSFLIDIVALAKFITKKRKIKDKFKNDISPEKNIKEILDKNLKNFTIEYYGIENIEIKKGVFQITFMREYPLTGKKCSFHFDRINQFDIESIFMKTFPKKTNIKSD